MQVESGKRAGTSRSYGFPYYGSGVAVISIGQCKEMEQRLTTLSPIKTFHSHRNRQGGLWWRAAEKEECETLPQSTFRMAVQASG
jgi:hypothetical protein